MTVPDPDARPEAVHDPTEGLAERIVRTVRCPVHGSRPDVRLIPHPSGSFKIEGEMCCSELEHRVQRLMGAPG